MLTSFRRFLVCCISLTLVVISSYGQDIMPGSYQLDEYLPILKGKKIALIANHTSRINTTHLLDTLLSLNISVKKIMSPEHGFRGTEDAGAKIKNVKDKKTGLPIISLYGANQKPKQTDLADVDIVVFDMQDVGVRFYTYLSTMRLVMEACAEFKKPLLILDRPNPNGFYVDGPVLEADCKSFVGLDPVPVVYGMTLAEYAEMANNEGWLAKGLKCDLKYVLCKNYTHSSTYDLPVKPSPNLPTMRSIYSYPSLCFFEGTIVSVGRGTEEPFTIIGYPGHKGGDYEFVPVSIKGAAKSPLYEGQKCNGYKLDFLADQILKERKMDLSWVIKMYKESEKKDVFFNNYFKNLAGTKKLEEQIKNGMDINEIRTTWEPSLSEFITKRKKYLLYAE